MDLGGSAENQGDLKSVVLHKMTLASQKSTFPIALGVRITGVDDATYSQTGGLILSHKPQRASARALIPHPCLRRELLDDLHAQRRLAHPARSAGGQY